MREMTDRYLREGLLEDPRAERSSGDPQPRQSMESIRSAASMNIQPLRFWALCALIFYEVCGGPFGMEDAVAASSPRITLLGFLILPFLWSIPEALVTAELVRKSVRPHPQRRSRF